MLPNHLLQFNPVYVNDIHNHYPELLVDIDSVRLEFLIQLHRAKSKFRRKLKCVEIRSKRAQLKHQEITTKQ